MGHLEKYLIKEATRKHKKIFPCAHKKDLNDCFTKDEGRLMLWFNTEDQSTHVVATDINKKAGKNDI